jgi:hypothetical protein
VEKKSRCQRSGNEVMTNYQIQESIIKFNHQINSIEKHYTDKAELDLLAGNQKVVSDDTHDGEVMTLTSAKR